MTRTFKSEKKHSEVVTFDLPLDRPVAVYYRQSTDDQVGNISTSMQTVDMVSDLQHRGWNEQDIILIDMDAGVSGTTKIDEREGMRQLFSLIVDGVIGAVACVDEDRLFRDVTQIQVNIFIEACRASQVQVITPSVCYIFHHPEQGDFFRRQFRFKSEMAAEYLKFLTGRLGAAKERLHREGKWSGQRIPIGYMVDVRKEVDGQPNPNYRKFVPFEPYAELIREYFRIFVEANGSRLRTQRIIIERGLLYPEIVPPAGFKAKHHIGRYRVPTTTAFDYMVTNPVYLGHWMNNGEIVLWNNHEPIVPEDLFYQAFNIVSKYSLTGTENKNFRGIRPGMGDYKGRPKLVDPPLWAGFVHAWAYDGWKELGYRYRFDTNRYTYYYLRVEATEDGVIFQRDAENLEEALLYHLRKKMAATEASNEWRMALEKLASGAADERKRLDGQIAALERSMKDIEDNLFILTHPVLVKKKEEQYVQMEAELKRLKEQRHNLEAAALSAPSLATFEQDYQITMHDWDKATRDTKRRIIAFFFKRVELTAHDKAGKLTDVCIYWFDGSMTKFDITRAANSKHEGKWTYSEKATLYERVMAGATPQDLLEALPNRDWGAIRRMFKKLMPDLPLPPKTLTDENINRMCFKNSC